MGWVEEAQAETFTQFVLEIKRMSGGREAEVLPNKKKD